MNQLLKEQYVLVSYPDRGVEFVDGDGLYLIDSEGNRFLDLASNYGVNIFGYKHERTTRTLTDQLEKLPTLHGSFGSEVRNEAARQLVQKCGGKCSSVFFSNSGSEAIEAALKFARLYSGKSHFIAMHNGYHGKTLGALSATSGDKYRDPFLPLLWNFSHVDFGDIEQLQRMITAETAGIFLEPIQGEGGIRIPSAEFLRAVQKLCVEHNILFIVDEIQSGVGRTGTFLACKHFELQPDILCLGKGLAGGIPIGATLVSKKIAQSVPIQVHTSTFGGNPLACAGVLAVLKEFENPELLAHIKSTGKYFLSELKRLDNSCIVEARGMGLMLGLELATSVTPILKQLQSHKIIAIPSGSNVLRFLPPYLVSTQEVDHVLNILRAIMST